MDVAKFSAFAIVSIILCLASAGFWWLGNTAGAVVFSALLVMFIIITRGIWQGPNADEWSYRKFVFRSIVVLATSQTVWLVPDVKLHFAAALSWIGLSSISPDIIEHQNYVRALIIFAFVATCLFILRPSVSTAMRRHPVALHSDFPSDQEQQQLRAYCSRLLSQMYFLDQQTSWTEEYFTPLDAQVDSGSGRSVVSKVQNLLVAIKPPRWKNSRIARRRIFLVLGDPGSGKSVALRKLATDLLREINPAGRIPIYVNLKEWTTTDIWTEERPRTVDNFVQFILGYMKEQSDVLSKKFIDAHFYKLLSGGRFFFILDSFDEIPQVLDSDEHSWIIRELSNILVKFFDSSPQMEGVIGSREFKQPRMPRATHQVLKIIPFSEDKIRDAFSRKQFCDADLVTRMFRERLDLVALSRNPFTAAMIADYMIGERQLPANQGEIFLHYINDRLESSNERMAKRGVSRQDVEEGAVAMAMTMFATPSIGLEATAKDLQANIPGVRVAEIADVLTFARIGRYGPGPEGRFSFIHRRFHEYFLVQGLLAGKAPVEAGAIPTDSRWRDALVLYCALAREEEAVKVAAYCWEYARSLEQADIPENSSAYLGSVHCLRFLGEAFRYRREILSWLQKKLAELVLGKTDSNTDMLVAKIAVEAVGLIADRDVERVVQKALRLENPWISETALRACRHLPTIAPETQNRLVNYVLGISTWEFLKRYRELHFSLSEPRRVCRRLQLLRGWSHGQTAKAEVFT